MITVWIASTGVSPSALDALCRTAMFPKDVIESLGKYQEIGAELERGNVCSYLFAYSIKPLSLGYCQLGDPLLLLKLYVPGFYFLHCRRPIAHDRSSRSILTIRCRLSTPRR